MTIPAVWTRIASTSRSWTELGSTPIATWIALFRGINVGGHNKLAMKELRADLESLGCEDVGTVIQSGNAVFRSPARSATRLADSISACIEDRHGFRPAVLVLSRAELKAAVEGNPFTGDTVDPARLAFFFLTSDPEPAAVKRLKPLKSSSERYALAAGVFYLHAPDGVGRSKLAATVEKTL
ncbi:hypothetical protein DRQ32_06690, partial [bacterium]